MQIDDAEITNEVIPNESSLQLLEQSQQSSNAAKKSSPVTPITPFSGPQKQAPTLREYHLDKEEIEDRALFRANVWLKDQKPWVRAFEADTVEPNKHMVVRRAFHIYLKGLLDMYNEL